MTRTFGGLVAGAILMTGCYASHERGECTEPTQPALRVQELGDEPWLEIVGPEQVIARAEPGEMGAPHVAWDGSSWSVAWGRRFAQLDARGQPRGPVERLAEGGDATSLAPGSCARGVVAAGDAPGESVVSWVEGDGTTVDVMRVAGIDADIARAEGGFWIASDTTSASGPPQLTVHTVRDGELGRVASRIVINDGALRYPRITRWGEGAVVSWVDERGIVQRPVGTRGHETTWRVMTANVWGSGAMEVATLELASGEERIIVGATDGAAVHVAISDPRLRQVIAGPIAVMRTTARHAAPGIAPMPERGRIAVCVPGSDAERGGVSVAVIGEDALPVVRPVAVGGGVGVRAATCAWNGEELLVVWWRGAAGSEELAARRVRVQDGSEVPDIVW